MVKKITSLNIDSDVVQKAKHLGLNLSAVAEKALRERSGEVTFNPNDPKACDFCLREMEKAIVDNPNIGLNWLWPDEKWICQDCLRRGFKIL